MNTPHSTSTTEPAAKQAACLTCRRSKTRCVREPGDETCQRCVQTKIQCVIPDYRVGRKKGVKNKRDGLDKAVFAIEQALKRSRTRSDEEGDVFLRGLLRGAREVLHRGPGEVRDLSSSSPGRDVPYEGVGGHVERVEQSLPAALPAGSDDYAVDDAENPLQLLARASDLSSPPVVPQAADALPPFTPQSSVRLDDRQKHDVQPFFGPFRPSLDVGEDIDPIDMGLVTFEETDILFDYFYHNLSHTRWGLDQFLHTPKFVRSRSAFLFTSILAASALFLPSTSALSRRLSNHCRYLAHHVVASRHRSPELVLGFMINVPWMPPGKHWSDDDTCSYMSEALTIAMDISLDKVIVPRASRDALPRVAQSECITAQKALDLDGFHDVDPSSPLGRRLLRRRERIWLALFVLDRGVCLARGRSYTVPLTPLIESCDEWHISDLSDVWDGSIISSAVFRRDLVHLIDNVRDNCGRNLQIAASLLQDTIEGFFNRWYATWAFAIGGTNGNLIPPYVEILVTHGRLSIYSSVINHPTAPTEVKRFFRSAGFSSALSVMRAAVQGEERLKSMPNNTVIMISFAAMICFRLSTIDTSTHSLAPSIRLLIEETADVLERIGSTPGHRRGISVLYGRHLRDVIGRRGTHRRTPLGPALSPVGVDRDPLYQAPPIHFSAMSDDQIDRAVRDAGGDLGSSVAGLPGEGSGLDWLDWFDLDVHLKADS